MKRLIYLLLTLLLSVVLLAGCKENGDAGTKGEDAARDESMEETDPDASEGPVIYFETTDLDGNMITSEDIFSDNRITMVNLWATYCGPCIMEMPDLKELDEELKEKDCAVIGVVLDVSSSDDTKMIDTAKEVIDRTGADYMHLVPWDNWYEDMPTNAVPTTYFVDSEGMITGSCIIGANEGRYYKSLIERLLYEMDQQTE